MTVEKLSTALDNISENYVYEAATYTAKKKINLLLKWSAIAACLCLIIGVAFRVAIAFVPSQTTDIFREGNLIEITGKNELPAQYDGKLLAFNLDFESYEFYYKFGGIAENTDDWYSLLASKYDANGDVLLHCMFDAAIKEHSDIDWKVDSVFTAEATKKVTVNGIELEIAEFTSLKYKYWHYVFFIYDGVVYDVRVKSDNAEYVYEVIDILLKSE